MMEARLVGASSTSAKVGPYGVVAMPYGIRFHPTDVELVGYYLKRWICNEPIRVDIIAEVDIYMHEPWQLQDKAKLKSREEEWYFFCRLPRMGTTNVRRTTPSGYWKTSGVERQILRESQLIAMKRTLLFHFNQVLGGQRTNWFMYEYRLSEEELRRIGAPLEAKYYTLCRVFHKTETGSSMNIGCELCNEEEHVDVQAIPEGQVVQHVHNDCAGPSHVNMACEHTTTTKAPVVEVDVTPPPRTTSEPELVHVVEGMPPIPSNATIPASLGLLPPSNYQSITDDLQSQYLCISTERRALRLEVINGRAMVSALQGQINLLEQEKETLMQLRSREN